MSIRMIDGLGRLRSELILIIWAISLATRNEASRQGV